ncbi:rhodanese-like domain-containing protein [Melghirimyces algeriensis]|uniref:Rhodanese-related sulfurtransferase n=1 Tax=Melghirimyces algeriensis TaxID=910412 RepID=A0A521CE40_9BACL|nr:rhodanese-like domain-containing protein [Melghirimyces algeriensis]SMO57699.1 Rhodanese-related sulfurtransferase [Melghirimyces algeriensis]
MKKDKKTLLVDVRDRDEYEQGHVDGAISVPLEELTEKSFEWQEHEVTVVCNYGGQRSQKAKEILEENGVSVSILPGGYHGWKSKQGEGEGTK